MADETQEVTLPYYRPPYFRTIAPDGFNVMFIQVSSGEYVYLTATSDEVVTESETFAAEVVPAGLKQKGESKRRQITRKVEEVALKLTRKLTVDLLLLLIRNLKQLGPAAFESAKAEFAKLEDG